MEAFVVVLLAAAMLGVGVGALLLLRRMRRLTDPTRPTRPTHPTEP